MSECGLRWNLNAACRRGTELCKAYHITQETGHYWLRRYQQGGLEALLDRDRAPRHKWRTLSVRREPVLLCAAFRTAA